MASVTNNHRSAIRLPGGTVLNPGVATNVPKWDDEQKNTVVGAWVKKGVLSVGDRDVSTEDEKDQIRARLDELGVDYKKNLGLAKLRELLAEADTGEG